MSTFNLQEGVESNERSKPAPKGLILSVPGKPLVKYPQPVLYRKESLFYCIPTPKGLIPLLKP